MSIVAAVASDDGLRAGLVVTTYGFGLRHGVDWDHIAAISDITSSQESSRRSMLFATLYALGHATVVLLLGSLAVVAGDRLPPTVDVVMERVVGVTLLLLGGYVFYALVRHGRDFRLRSRWMLVFSGAARLARRVRRSESRSETVEIVHDHPHGPEHGHLETHALPRAVDGKRSGPVAVAARHRHPHRHRGPMPDDPFVGYGRWTSWAVGMLHGVGAETATQVVVFLTAARAGGVGSGLLLLVVFVLGLVTSNTVIAAVATVGYLNATRSFGIYATIAVVTGAFSLVIGTLFVTGQGVLLPAILGGLA